MALFDPHTGPRIFGLPHGVDFAAELVRGLIPRLDRLPPEQQARAELYVATPRMQRIITAHFDKHGPRFLPRIRLIGDLGHLPGPDVLPAPISSLRKRLELVTLIRQLLTSAPDMAPRSALFDLADSLARLLDEMQGEGVVPEALRGLDVTDQSGHWQRALTFVNIVEQFIENSEDRPDAEGRRRAIVEALCEAWETAAPSHPVIVAGSTGSRGATALFMKAVAHLPQGAVILPGYDTDLPANVWDGMGDALTAEDHPQYRFRRLMNLIGFAPDDVQMWSDGAPASPARNRLLSLALRPAPVTDAWLTEGPALPDLDRACEGLTLVEAPSPRLEAGAIALIMREALEQNRSVALISPDSMLTRQVRAALGRWSIVPDDSTGLPLPLSPPGRLLRQVADLYGQRVDALSLLRILKHPLTCAGSPTLQNELNDQGVLRRGQHLLRTRELELAVRRDGCAFPDGDWLRKWATPRAEKDEGIEGWITWIEQTILSIPDLGDAPLTTYVEDHLNRTENIVAGPDGNPAPLWAEAAGRTAKPVIQELRQEASACGDLTARDYAGLLYGVLATEEVRDRDAGHPMAAIWGTQEARVGRADVMILAGLNEGMWPGAPNPDPWLNRAMRARVGLLLPERQIGLSAHDFQQAITAPEVVLTRAIRSEDAQSVPSRWLNRLMNLLNGLPDTGGRDALQGMKDRGDLWVRYAEELERPGDVPRAKRPSPCPPVSSRPDAMSVTEVQTLIRDPYAIYAKHVLRLRPLDPLSREPDARLRGTVLHAVLEEFVKSAPVTGAPEDKDRLLTIAQRVIDAEVPWSVTRTFYMSRIQKFADWFIACEAERQKRQHPTAWEVDGKLVMETAKFTLRAKADRMDTDDRGYLVLYDYKSGAAPTGPEQKYYDKQLLLMSAMAEEGAFENIPPTEVARASYIALSKMKEQSAPVEETEASTILAEFHALLSAYRDPDQGYTSRRAPKNEGFEGDYDQLARFGEWEATDHPEREVLK